VGAVGRLSPSAEEALLQTAALLLQAKRLEPIVSVIVSSLFSIALLVGPLREEKILTSVKFLLYDCPDIFWTSVKTEGRRVARLLS
jgi:hypothetical protein